MSEEALSLDGQLRTLEGYRTLLERIPFASFLGIDVLEIDDDGLLVRLCFDDHLVGNPHLPAIHGGVIGAFLETAAILELIHSAKIESIPKTIDVTIDYLRSAKGQDVFARSIVTKRGRRVANVRTEAWQGDREKPIAASRGHFLLGID